MNNFISEAISLLKAIEKNISFMEQYLAEAPEGSLMLKNVKGRTYTYQRIYENGKCERGAQPHRLLDHQCQC